MKPLSNWLLEVVLGAGSSKHLGNVRSLTNFYSVEEVFRFSESHASQRMHTQWLW